MAAYDDYSMGGFSATDYETEEERKRRLAAEQAQAQDQESGGITALRPESETGGFGAIPGRYLNRRLNEASNRVSNAAEMFTNPEQALNKRMGMAEQSTTEPVAPTPVKQTITTDPQTGEQKMKIEGSVQDLSAANPLTPTVTGPAVPTAPQPAPAPVVQQQQMPPQPATMPTATAEGTAGEAQAQAAMARPQLPPMPQPGPGVQVAGPAVPGAMPPPAVTPTGQPVVGAPQTMPNLAQGGAQAQVAGTAALEAPAQVTRPQWAIDMETAGTDQDKLVDIAANKTYPRDVREDAKAKLRTVQDNAIAAKDAEKTVTAAAQGDPKAQQKLLNSIKPASVKKDEDQVTEGSYIRAYLYARLGLTDLAKEEQEKILGRSKFGQAIVNGAAYEVETDPRTGRVISARDNEGNKVDTPILNKIRAESSAAKSTVTHTGKMQDVTTGEVYYERTTPQGIQLIDNNGKLYKGSSANLRPFGIGSDIATKNQIQINELQNKLGYAGATASAAEREKVLAESEARYGPLPEAFKSAVRAGQPLPTGLATGTAIQQTSPAQAPAVSAPIATSNVPVNPNAPTTPAVSTVNVGGTTPAGRIAGTEINTAAVKDRNKANQDYSDSLATSRQTAAAQNSTINRLQSAIDKNPNFWGIDTNSSAWRAFVDVNSTNAEKGESLNTLARNMNIPKEQRTAFDSVMNDYRNLQVNAITGSGLTASQTNTERESQRVMGTVGAISDRPAAAKATLEYAKAKIEYTDAKARAWAQARKTNPGIDRLDFETRFDATTGEQIFQKANERMNKILGGAGETPTVNEGQTGTSRSGKPMVYRNGRWEYQ